MALTAMMAEMRAAGFDDVYVTSAYRTYSYQAALFNTYINDEMTADPTLSYEQAKQKVSTYSAEPGTSEHQSGLCVDLMTLEMLHLVNYGNETDDEGDKRFAEPKAFT
jgi:LAS superfamily LD-carboxypeptidase LdcB